MCLNALQQEMCRGLAVKTEARVQIPAVTSVLESPLREARNAVPVMHVIKED